MIAILTPLSKALASAAVWKVRPNFLLSVLQWWKVGITRLYSKSLLMVQFRTIWKKKNKTEIIMNPMQSWFFRDWNHKHLQLGQKFVFHQWGIRVCTIGLHHHDKSFAFELIRWKGLPHRQVPILRWNHLSSWPEPGLEPQNPHWNYKETSLEMTSKDKAWAFTFS